MIQIRKPFKYRRQGLPADPLRLDLESVCLANRVVTGDALLGRIRLYPRCASSHPECLVSRLSKKLSRCYAIGRVNNAESFQAQP
jgi:hypothetical protein